MANRLLLYNVTRFFILAAVVVALMVSAQRTLAQDPEPAPTAILVVAPQDLVVGQRTEAAGFHVYPDDLEVKITYDSAYLAPDGVSCIGNTTGSTATATSSLGVVLTACSAGTTYVRLVVADDTEYVIAERDVIITKPSGTTGRAESDPSISLSSIPSSLDVGESDRITVRVTDLDDTLDYELITVPRNDKAFMFNSGCTTDRKEEDIRARRSSRKATRSGDVAHPVRTSIRISTSTTGRSRPPESPTTLSQ